MFLTFLLVLSTCIQTALSACRFSDGNYKLQWTVDSKNTIQFMLTYKDYPSNSNSWMGVAFGEGMMSGLDAILVKNLNGHISVSDESVFGYGPANTDSSQDVEVESAKVKNGVLRVKFSRPTETSDKQADLPLSGCTTWQFITSINPAAGGHTHKHIQTPITKQVCLKQCVLDKH